MVLISVSLIFNAIVFYLDMNSNIESVIPFIVMGSLLGLYKSIQSNDLKEAFNVNCFQFTLNKQHIFELISSFILSLSIYDIYIYHGDFNLIDVVGLILFTLFIYRFLLFNLLKKSVLEQY